MKTMQKVTMIGIVTLVISSAAYADCRKSHVSDDYGNNCQYKDICQDSLDLPSIDLDPLPSFANNRFETIALLRSTATRNIAM